MCLSHFKIKFEIQILNFQKLEQKKVCFKSIKKLAIQSSLEMKSKMQNTNAMFVQTSATFHNNSKNSR